MNARDLRSRFDVQHVTALNELVHAVDRLKAPAIPEVPEWKDTPASIECLGEETRTPEELIAIGLEWQVITSPENFGDVENLIAGVQAKAERAREALITLGGYEAPLPSFPERW